MRCSRCGRVGSDVTGGEGDRLGKLVKTGRGTAANSDFVIPSYPALLVPYRTHLISFLGLS